MVAAASCLAPLIEEYLQHLEYVRKYSPHTVSGRARELRALEGYAQAAGVRELVQIDNHLIRSFISRLHAQKRQPVTLHRYLSSVRSFLTHQVRQGRLQANPAAGVRAPKIRRKLPGQVTADALNAALDRPTEGPHAVLDRAIVELFYSAGLRLAELHQLDAAPLAHGERELVISGKGRKQRVVMVGARARAALDRWLDLRAGLAGVAEGALFVGPGGRRLSRTGVAAAVTRWARAAGLPGRLHPHRLRHSFASHLLENSGDLRAVQELLGHAHLSTTQVYTHLDWKRLARIYDTTHPRARRK